MQGLGRHNVLKIQTELESNENYVIEFILDSATLQGLKENNEANAEIR